MTGPDRDQSWADWARATREALALLGRPIDPPCLPGEPNPCGAGFGEHALAHMATLQAIMDHQLDTHLVPDGEPASALAEWQSIYDRAAEELALACPTCRKAGKP